MFTNIEDEIENLIFNLQGGLPLERLTKDEVDLLVSKYGDNWFEALGYDDESYSRPVFE